MSNRLFFATFISLVLVGAFLGGRWKPGDVREVESTFSFAASKASIQQQKANQRVWMPLPTTRNWSVTTAGISELQAPMGLKVNSQGHSFVTEYAKGVIHEFSADGEFIRTYRPSKGTSQQPSVTDLAFGPKGEVYVVNATLKEIEVFNQDGRIHRVIKPQRTPYHLAVQSPDRFTLLLSYPSDFLFGGFPPGDAGSYFGRLADKKEALALDGWIENDQHGGFVYTGIHSGFIASYDAASNLRYIRQTINGAGLPRLNEDARGRLWVDPDWPRSARSLSVADNEVHILSEASSGPKRIGAVDTYDLQEGKYLYSRRLPEPCRQVIVTQSHFYTLTDSKLSQWNLPPKASRFQVAGIR